MKSTSRVDSYRPRRFCICRRRGTAAADCRFGDRGPGGRASPHLLADDEGGWWFVSRSWGVEGGGDLARLKSRDTGVRLADSSLGATNRACAVADVC